MCKRIGRKLLLMLAVVMLFVCCASTDSFAAAVLKPKKAADGKLTPNKPKQSYQITAGQTGYIKIVFEYDVNDAYASVNVYDNVGKQAGSVYCGSEKDKAVGYVAVKKGTYTVEADYQDYLKFAEERAAEAVSEGEEPDEIEDMAYSIKYTFYSMQEGKKAASRSSAPSLKKGSEVSGLIFADNSKKDGYAALYKYTVSKRTKVKFHLNMRGDGVWMQILDAGGEPLDLDEEDNSMVLDEDSFTCWYDTNRSYSVKLDAGTYYFAFLPREGATGFYKLELK